jgi:hypothetical protein
VVQGTEYRNEVLSMRNLTRRERAEIMLCADTYLQYNTMLNRDDFTLWAPAWKRGMDRVYVDQKIVSKVVR